MSNGKTIKNLKKIFGPSVDRSWQHLFLWLLYKTFNIFGTTEFTMPGSTARIKSAIFFLFTIWMQITSLKKKYSLYVRICFPRSLEPALCSRLPLNLSGETTKLHHREVCTTIFGNCGKVKLGDKTSFEVNKHLNSLTYWIV